MAGGKPASVRDLWLHKDLGTFVDSFHATSVPGTGVVMIKLTPKP